MTESDTIIKIKALNQTLITANITLFHILNLNSLGKKLAERKERQTE